jgi:hypothetical protein
MMLGMYKLDGKTPVPCEDTIEWAIWFDKADRHVALDKFWGIKVSTVFLGMDHSWNDGPPVLFETMVFFGKSWCDVYQDRYCTWEEAEVGHTQVVKAMRRNPWKWVVWPSVQFKYRRARYTIIDWADKVKGKVSHGIFRTLDYLRSSRRLP